MLPEGWTKTSLEGHVRIYSGLAPGTLDPMESGPIPYVKVEDLNNCDKYQVDSREYLQASNSVIPTGCLIFPKRGAAIFSNKIRIATRPMVLDTNLMGVEAGSSLHREFLYYAIGFAGLHSLADTSTIPQLNNKHIYPFQLQRPTSIREQARIAEVLATWDDAIATTEKLLVNSQLHTQTMSHALLSGQRRLANSTTWSRKRVGELISESRAPGSSGDVARKLTVRLYGRGVIAKNERRQGSEATTYYRRRAGQFIYSKLDFLNGAFGLIPPHLDGYESTLDLPAFDFLGDVDSRWLLYYVSREAFYQGHLSLANGGRKARRVNPQDFLQISIDFPPLAEQQAIARAIDTLREDERKWATMCSLLHTEKRAVMADLLTGKRRIPIPDNSEEAQETA